MGRNRVIPFPKTPEEQERVFCECGCGESYPKNQCYAIPRKGKEHPYEFIYHFHRRNLFVQDEP